MGNGIPTSRPRDRYDQPTQGLAFGRMERLQDSECGQKVCSHISSADHRIIDKGDDVENQLKKVYHKARDNGRSPMQVSLTRSISSRWAVAYTAVGLWRSCRVQHGRTMDASPRRLQDLERIRSNERPWLGFDILENGACFAKATRR